MPNVMEGVRLLEVADWGFVPSAAAVLGDWGADVVKIEHPLRGDPIRGLVAFGKGAGGTARSFFVEHLGRNKRSIGLDLRTKEGYDVLLKLVEGADIFLTNHLPGVRQRLHIAVEDLRKVNPNLIYAKGHGHGQRGPDATRGGFDGLSFWARCGVADRLTPEGKEPLGSRPAFGDSISGMFIAGGLAGALFHRQRTGEALEVDVSLMGAATWVMAPDIVAAMMYGVDLPRSTGSGANAMRNALVAQYQCVDGRYLSLMMLQEPRYWPIFCKAIGREDLMQDERFSADDVRINHVPELVEVLKEIFKQRTRSEWSEMLNASRCIWGPVQTPSEVPNDPQVIANGYIMDVEREGEDTVRVASSPVQFNSEFMRARRPAPELGAHTEEVLLEVGYDWDDITRLRQAKAI